MELDSKNRYPIDKHETQYNEIQNLIKRFSDQVNRQREEQIIEALNDRGYNLDINNRSELEQFAKRCTIAVFPSSNKKILIVDEKPVLEWWDTVDFSFDSNKIYCIACKTRCLGEV